MKSINTFYLWFIFMLPYCVLYSNNVMVENISLTGLNTTNDYTYVEFDISWDNSWRDLINWDAAWVFVKYKGSDGLWNHANLDVDDGDHTAPAGTTINTGNDYTGIYAAGVFICRNATGSGTNNWDNVHLRWNYGENAVADDDLVTVKVFAIEMVYVPQATFDLGDGSGGGTMMHFYDAGLGNVQPFIVDSQGAITTAASGAGNLWASVHINPGTSNANFPTGYNAFYCMKYEITQEQYIDFLNTLTRTGTDISGTSITNVYVMSNSPTMTYRNGIRCDVSQASNGSIEIYCDYDGDGIRNETDDGQNIACGFLNWMDGCAYADWAGLRPKTELEFEKACRGGQPAVAGEYSWGNTNIHNAAYTLSDGGSYNEIISGPSSDSSNINYNMTSGLITGPMRVGIFALNATSRQEAGASYYGIMELSGNIYEHVVTIVLDEGMAFNGNQQGDGELSLTGNANGVSVASWPGWNGSEVDDALGSGIRGGGFASPWTFCHVSQRREVNAALTTRYQYSGFRPVRSAPSP